MTILGRYIVPAYRTTPARVTWRVQAVVDVDEYSIEDFITLINDAVARIVTDGVSLSEIKIRLDYDSEPDYDNSNIVTPKVTVVAQREATLAEVESEKSRQVEFNAASRVTELARLRSRLAELEGTI